MSKIGFSSNPSNGASHTWRNRRRFNYSSSKGGWQSTGATPPTPSAPTLNTNTDLQDMNDATGLAARMRGMAVMYNSYNDFPTEAYTGSFAYARDTNELYVWTGASPALFTWGGDRAVIAGGWVGGANTNNMEYFSISSFTASASFGSLGTSRHFLRGGGSNGTTGIFPGGYLSSSGPRTDEIKYITTATTSTASNFGVLTSVGDEVATASNGVYGIMAGGGTRPSVIDYVTIATTSNATSFGSLTIEPREGITATSDANYILLSGGANLSGGASETLVEYVVASTPGNATSYGTLTTATDKAAGFSDQTRSIIAGGEIANTNYLDTIEYITTAVGGTSTSFGNLTINRGDTTGAGDGTYGVVVAGKPQGSNGSSVVATMDYLTIQTTSNAQSFGNLTTSRASSGGLSGNAA